MIRRPPRSTRVRSSAASDVYKRQLLGTSQQLKGWCRPRKMHILIPTCPPKVPCEVSRTLCMCMAHRRSRVHVVRTLHLYRCIFVHLYGCVCVRSPLSGVWLSLWSEPVVRPRRTRLSQDTSIGIPQPRHVQIPTLCVLSSYCARFSCSLNPRAPGPLSLIHI